jgi:STAM-binding protein
LWQARTSSEEGHLDNAYMLYVRHCNLVLNDLSAHPESKKPENKNAIRRLAKGIPGVMEELQVIKPVLEANYDEWVKINAAQTPPNETRKRAAPHISGRDLRASWYAAPTGRVLDAGEHQDLAVELAQQALETRAAKRAARQKPITEQEEQERRTGGVWEDWDGKESSQDRSRFAADQDLQRQMAATRRMLDRQDDDSHGTTSDRQGGDLDFGQHRPMPARSTSSTYHYPAISHSSVARHPLDGQPAWDASPLQKPPRPAKVAEPKISPGFSNGVAPLVPSKERNLSYESSPSYPRWDSEETPQRPPKQPVTSSEKRNSTSVTFKASAYLENGSPLRPVFLPHKLRLRFLDIAADLTRRGVEMCGILCGTKVNGALFISVLLIPEQTGTSDTCETENEWSRSEFCEENTLEVFGWIHTHPTQTCFMSSRDLHTQAGYQTFLPESIAIVCSPRREPS